MQKSVTFEKKFGQYTLIASKAIHPNLTKCILIFIGQNVFDLVKQNAINIKTFCTIYKSGL